MEKLYVRLKNSPPQSYLKEGDEGYIHAYVQGIGNRPYAIVVCDEVIEAVALYHLEAMSA